MILASLVMLVAALTLAGCAAAPVEQVAEATPGAVECAADEECYDPTDCRDYFCDDGVCVLTLHDGEPVTCGHTECERPADCTSSVYSATTCDANPAGRMHPASCDPTQKGCVPAGPYGVCAQHAQ